MRIRGLIWITIILAGCSPAAKTPARGPGFSWSANERAIPVLQEKLRTENKNNPELNAALGQAYLQKARETGDPSYYTKGEQLFERAAARFQYQESLRGERCI